MEYFSISNPTISLHISLYRYAVCSSERYEHPIFIANVSKSPFVSTIPPPFSPSLYSFSACSAFLQLNNSYVVKSGIFIPIYLNNTFNSILSGIFCQSAEAKHGNCLWRFCDISAKFYSFLKYCLFIPFVSMRVVPWLPHNYYYVVYLCDQS